MPRGNGAVFTRSLPVANDGKLTVSVPNLAPGTYDVVVTFRGSYRFQRSIEARIRLMDAAGRHELPETDRELAKLAYLLGYSRPQELVDEAQHKFAENRARFNRIFDAAERS